MKINDEDIRFVDRWLQFSGIEYLDVRYELVDHLITEYEQSAQEISIESFVKERLNWCKSTAKKKEKAMHWGIQKGLWRRILSLFKDLKIILPLLVYVLFIFILKDHFSTRTVRLLFFGPVFLTIMIFLYQLGFKNFGRKKKEKVLVMQKLGSLFALPQIFLSLFFYPSIWSIDNERMIDNYYITLPCVIVMTLINLAAILEYIEHYKRIVKDYVIIRETLL